MSETQKVEIEITAMDSSSNDIPSNKIENIEAEEGKRVKKKINIQFCKCLTAN